MTWTIEHPQQHRRFGRDRIQTMSDVGVRAWARPLGAGGVGLWTLLLAAWGGISVFVGPTFGYRPTTLTSWDWTKQNWLLHLVPGAVGVFAGLLMLGTIGAREGWRRGGLGVASLLTMAAGAWFVIGPSAYHWFQSAAAFNATAAARSDFANQVGSNLGPGVLLAILGGMAFKAGIANPRVVLERAGESAAGAASPASPATAASMAPPDAAASAAPPAGAASPARPAAGAPSTPPAKSDPTRSMGDRGPNPPKN